MLALFRSHYAFNHLFLLVYIVLIRVKSFFLPEPAENTPMTWLYESINHALPSSIWPDLMAILLLWIQSILINNLVNNHKLSRESTLFPGLMYVLFMSLLPNSLFFSPIIISTLFILSGIINVVQAGKQIDIRHFVFNAGLFFMIAVFIMPQNLYFPIMGLVGFYSIKTLKWKENFQYLTGMLVGVIVIFCAQYLDNSPIDFPIAFQWFNLSVLSNEIPYSILVGLLVYAVFLVFIFIQFPSLTEKKNIQTRKKIEFFYLLLLFLLVAFFSLPMDQSIHLSYLALPIGVLVGIWMADQKSVLATELLHLLVVAGLVLSHYILW